jgi:hypothetical protein
MQKCIAILVKKHSYDTEGEVMAPIRDFFDNIFNFAEDHVTRVVEHFLQLDNGATSDDDAAYLPWHLSMRYVITLM